MKTKIVKLDEFDLEVKKLPIGKYAELIGALKEIPKHIESLEKVDNENLIKNLPSLVSKSLPELINILPIATDLTKEQVDKLGLEEVVNIVLAVVEVNNYQGIFAQIKKATAQTDKPAEVKK